MADSDVKPEDIVSKLDKSVTDVEESTLSWLTELQKDSDDEKTLIAKENTGILKMRERWSNWVLILIGTIVTFDIILVAFYGSGVWSFENPNVVIAVITDNFLKIVGLGFLITREIFKKIYH